MKNQTKIKLNRPGYELDDEPEPTASRTMPQSSKVEPPIASLKVYESLA